MTAIKEIKFTGWLLEFSEHPEFKANTLLTHGLLSGLRTIHESCKSHPCYYKTYLRKYIDNEIVKIVRIDLGDSSDITETLNDIAYDMEELDGMTIKGLQ